MVAGERLGARWKTDNFSSSRSAKEESACRPRHLRRKWCSKVIEKLHAGVAVKVAVATRVVSYLDRRPDASRRGAINGELHLQVAGVATHKGHRRRGNDQGRRRA